MDSTTQGMLMLALISLVGVFGLLAAIFNWEWIYRARGASLLTRLIGRPACRCSLAYSASCLSSSRGCCCCAGGRPGAAPGH